MVRHDYSRIILFSSHYLLRWRYDKPCRNTVVIFKYVKSPADKIFYVFLIHFSCSKANKQTKTQTLSAWHKWGKILCEWWDPQNSVFKLIFNITYPPQTLWLSTFWHLNTHFWKSRVWLSAVLKAGLLRSISQ